jgi:CelD/BcsL family acetyltransferase involved in cellulose biosynthesis
VTEDGLGQRARYLRAVTPDGRIAGVLPLFDVRTLSGRVLVSVPLRDKGGPLAVHPDIAEQLARAAADLARQLGVRHVVIKGPAEHLTKSFDAAGYSEEKHWVTTVVPVDMGEERLWNEVFRSPTRRAVNKARNSGMVARWTTDATDLGRFYEVFLKTRRALGVPPYPRRFFDAMWRHLAPRGWLRLLLVEKDGTTQGALLVFPYKREVVSAYMGSDPASKDARVNDLLFWEAIRWSAAEGFASYYFGADSPHQEGLLQYKRKWGGQQFVLANYHYTSNGAPHVSTDSSSPQYARVRRVIAALPEPVFRAFGAVMTPRLW